MSDFCPEAAIEDFLQRFGETGKLCVAVSGGSDSLALLHLLHHHLGTRHSKRLTAVTVDHGLRAASAGEAEAVAQFCRSRGIDHRTMTWVGPKPANGLQDAARNARYELLCKAAHSLGAKAIVTAHTRDDQIETFAMRQARVPAPETVPETGPETGPETAPGTGKAAAKGAGRGLAGMAEAVLYRRQCWILRPLLRVSRAALRSRLAAASIAWSDDPSNVDRRFERVRIRMRDRDVQADEQMLQTMAARADVRRRQAETLARFLRGNVVIHGDMIAQLPLAPSAHCDDLQRAIGLLAALLGGRAYLPGASARDQIAQFVSGAGPARINLSRCVIDRRAKGIFLYREMRALPTLQVAPGCQALWDERYCITNRHPSQPLVVGPFASNRHPSWSELIENLPAELPRGVVSRAIKAQPAILAGHDGMSTGQLCQGIKSSDELSLLRYFAHFDLFLPEFECNVADICATLFGLPPYPQSPLSMNRHEKWQTN